MENNENQQPVLSSYTVYKEGLYFICTILISNMEHYLTEENRYYGRVKSYMDSIKIAKANGEEKMTDFDKENYGKILSVLRTQIKNDFKRLGNRKMSSADRIIILVRWILKIIDVIPEENYKFEKEELTISRIIEHLYDNIRNHSKKDQFHNLTKLIQDSINNGAFSDTKLLSINLVNEGLKKNYKNDGKKKKEFLIKTEKDIIKESNEIIKEIDFNNLNEK